MTSPFPKAYADFVQRLRVPAGFILLGGFVLLAHPTWVSILYSLPLILTGLWLRAWAAGHLEKNQDLPAVGSSAADVARDGAAGCAPGRVPGNMIDSRNIVRGAYRVTGFWCFGS